MPLPLVFNAAVLRTECSPPEAAANPFLIFLANPRAPESPAVQASHVRNYRIAIPLAPEAFFAHEEQSVVLLILAPVLLSGTLGWLVLRLFFRPNGRWLTAMFYLALGIPVGAGLFGLSSLFAMLELKLGRDSILAAFCIPAALAGCAGWLQNRGKLFRPLPLGNGGSGNGRIVTILSILCLIVCLAGALLLAGYFMAFPHGMWDAHAMWNARARVMFRAPVFWRDVFLPDHYHPDYPLSLSILVFTGWAAVGRETQTVPFALNVVFLLASAAIVAVGLAIWKNLAWALVPGTVMLSAQGYVALAGSQYADIPLSAMFAACIVLFTLAYREEEPNGPALALAGAVAGLCGWIKNEGTRSLSA